MENLRIDKPCPVLLSRMANNGNTLNCKSCQKEVIDFRNKTPEEIKALLTANTCGIFRNEQLSAPPRMTFFRKGVFAALTVLSFLGFNVGPVNASPARPVRTGITASSGTFDEKEKKPKSKKKKKHKKTKEFKTIGCPSF